MPIQLQYNMQLINSILKEIHKTEPDYIKVEDRIRKIKENTVDISQTISKHYKYEWDSITTDLS